MNQIENLNGVGVLQQKGRLKLILAHKTETRKQYTKKKKTGV